MKVLILSPYGDLIEDTVAASGCDPIIRPADLEVSDWPYTDWVVSFGYRKIIPPYTIDLYDGRIINIHLSLLPWNRGADPNFWSWFDGTPKGVTIHRVDSGIDTGEIINQICLMLSDFRSPYTLKTTYEDLQITAAGLFKRTWPLLLRDDHTSVRLTDLNDKGSYHHIGDMDKFLKYMTDPCWHTPINDIEYMGDLYAGRVL